MNNLVQTEPVKPDGVHHLIGVSDEGFKKITSSSPVCSQVYEYGLDYAEKTRDDPGAVARLEKWWNEPGARLPVFISSVNHAPTLVG